MFEITKVLPFKVCESCSSFTLESDHMSVSTLDDPCSSIVVLSCEYDYICKNFASLIDYKEE